MTTETNIFLVILGVLLLLFVLRQNGQPQSGSPSDGVWDIKNINPVMTGFGPVIPGQYVESYDTDSGPVMVDLSDYNSYNTDSGPDMVDLSDYVCKRR